jgi:hypothetical protein
MGKSINISLDLIVESLLVPPENAKQLKVVLKALNAKFEDQNEIPTPIINKVEEGLEPYAAGEKITLEEVKKKYFISQ